MINLELWRDRRNPRSLFQTWDAMTRDFDSFFDEFEKATGMSRTSGRERMMTPACDVSEDAKGYVLSFDLPGFKKEDVTIEVKGDALLVSGRRQREMQGEGTKSHRVERQYGEFVRTFTLPDDVKGGEIEASYENGVLYLVLPKTEAAKPKRIEIGEPKSGLLKRIVGLGKAEEDKKVVVNA